MPVDLDPRWGWWHQTVLVLRRARAALAPDQDAEQEGS